jgi:hypothetical protein
MTGRAERTADVVARLRAERPQASLAELAVAAGVSERHVRRLAADRLEDATTSRWLFLEFLTK